MGVDTTIYTFYGVKTDWNEDLYGVMNDQYSKNRSYFQKTHDLIDGMCCEYMIFGYQISAMGAYADDSDDVIELGDMDNLEQFRQEAIQEWRDDFPDFVDIIDQDWKTMVIRHYD